MRVSNCTVSVCLAGEVLVFWNVVTYGRRWLLEVVAHGGLAVLYSVSPGKVSMLEYLVANEQVSTPRPNKQKKMPAWNNISPSPSNTARMLSLIKPFFWHFYQIKVAFLLANLNPDFAIEKSIFFFCFFVFGLNQSKIAIRTIYL